MSDAKDSVLLKNELTGLFQYIRQVRTEIAAISRPGEDGHGFENMGDQLDAIVKATEEATEAIMGAIEKTDEAVAELRGKITDADQIALLDKIDENGQEVYQACSFQDITGQRITKVVKSVTYVEERVGNLIEIWGKAELDKVEIEAEEKTVDEKLLHGPQLDKKKSMAQAEIDALFD